MGINQPNPKDRVPWLLFQIGLDRRLVRSATDEQLADWADMLGAMVDVAKSGRPYNIGEQQHKSLQTDVPVLLRERKRILDEIDQRSSRSAFSELRAAVKQKVADPSTQREIIESVAEISQRREERSNKLQEQYDEIEAEKRRLENQKVKWDNIKSMLEREPAAVLIGGMLLVVVTITLLVAMFTHTGVPQIVSSAFLLILGFFFGQTAGGRRSE